MVISYNIYSVHKLIGNERATLNITKGVMI